MRPDAASSQDLEPEEDSTASIPSVPSTLRATLHGSAVDDVNLKHDAQDSSRSRRDKLSERPPQQRYELKKEIGRGGMGAVLKVFDSDLRRNLAMKVILEEGVTDSAQVKKVDPQLLARFLEEAQITGQLDHPGVVPVHELGIDTNGRVYFTMRLVRGEELSRIFERVHKGDREWNQTRALGALLKVCEATSFAHDKGVIHRDLKPANVMVGEYGEVYVMDWGLAKVKGRADSHAPRLVAHGDADLSSIKTDRKDKIKNDADSPLMTMDGAVFGTPYYMPPEQASGRIDEVDERSDVYAVGAMLYHLLTGVMPYHKEGDRLSPHTVLAMVLQGPPKDVRELAPGAQEELRDICTKAMERDPAERYASLRELAEDIRAFLEGRIESKRASIFEVLRLSTSLVLLYVGILVIALGPVTLLTLTWDSTNQIGRLLLCIVPLVGLSLAGHVLWKRSEWKTALPFLLGGAVIAPCLAFVLLHLAPGLGEAMDEEGELVELVIREFSPFADSGPEGSEVRRALDWKLLLVSLAAVAAGGFLRRMTKSQASYWYLCIAATACFFFVLALNGWRDLEDHLRAGTFLLFATSMIALGFMVELRSRPLDGRPFYVLGFLLFSAAWYVYAISGYPVLHIGRPPEREQVQLSFIIGGVISFLLGCAAQRAGTPLLSRYSTVPYLVAPSCVLVSLSILVAQEIRLYEVLLPVACLTFVVLSVAVQRKNLLYSGAAYISVAVFQITYNHFTDKWWWPLTLLLAGGALAAGSLVTGKIATRIKRKADGRATQS